MSDDNIFETNVILPPQSQEAEDGLIGAALLNPQGLEEMGFLEEEDFYFGKTKTIWRAMQKLVADKMPIDFLTVSDRLDKDGDLEGVGGPAALASLINNVPSINIEAYARIIKDKSLRRTVIQHANRLATVAFDETQPIGDGVGRVMDGLLNSSRPAEKSARHISHGLKRLYEFVDMRMQDPREVWGIPTGFVDIDHFMGGQHTGEVFYINGEPGIGKTRLALQMALQAALPENGSHPVAIYSFEMKELEIVKRLVSDRSNLTTFEMNSGKISDVKFPLFCNDIEYMESLPIYISDMPMNPQEFHADLLRLKRQHGVELYVLDYLTMMLGNEQLEESQRAAALSRQVKQITQAVDMAGITVSTVTKDVFGSEAPTNKGMRGSALVVHDADTIAFLTACTEPGRQNVCLLTFTKTRTIARALSKATIELVSDPDYPLFHSAARREVTRVINLNDYHG